MTILVDGARWRWRGQQWAHLVSDDSYEELHDFARRLGKRRLGFQGDHYDIDEIDHGRALRLGAEAIDSRDLVRRLRSAGLRNRAGKPRWQEVARWAPGVPLEDAAATMRPFGAAAHRLIRAISGYGAFTEGIAVVAFADPDHVVALLELGPRDTPPAVAVDVDLHVVGEPRADETSSIELFVRR